MKATFTSLGQRFVAVKGALEGRGSEPRLSHAQPWFFPRLCWAPRSAAGGAQCLFIANTVSQRPAASGGCPPTVTARAFAPSQTRGSQGGTGFPSWRNPQADISAEALRGDGDPPTLLLVSALSGCSLPLPKGKENFCHDHEDFFFLGQLLQLFGQGLRWRSDSKVHSARKRRGPQSPLWEGHGRQDQQKQRKTEPS